MVLLARPRAPSLAVSAHCLPCSVFCAHAWWEGQLALPVGAPPGPPGGTWIWGSSVSRSFSGGGTAPWVVVSSQQECVNSW